MQWDLNSQRLETGWFLYNAIRVYSNAGDLAQLLVHVDSDSHRPDLESVCEQALDTLAREGNTKVGAAKMYALYATGFSP